MELKELEQDIKQREYHLARCSFSLEALSSAVDADKETIRLVEQEAFFLRDQLDKYYSVCAILREEQGLNEAVLLQKV